jgi:hypothetical protein
MFRTWWPKRTNRHSRAAGRGRLRSAPTLNHQRPLLEVLEDRCLLSTSIPLSPFNWTPVGPAPIGAPDGRGSTGRISALATDPTNASIIYVGAASGGIWKTTNAGQTWLPKSDFQASLNIGAIALAPSNPNIIYAGTGENNFTGLPGHGILKSTDAGDHWTLLGQSVFDGKAISAIVINPTNPNVVYVTISENGAGVWRSTDGGNSWTALNPDGSISGLVMDPTNPQILYEAAGWIGGDLFNGIYRTTDGGTTWSVAGNFPRNSAGSNHVGRIALGIAPSAPGTLYAAISDPSNSQNLYKLMKTTNGNTANPAAVSWQDVTNNIGDVYGGQGWYDNVLTVDRLNANVVFVGGSTHFMTTITGGGSWSDLAFGLPNRPHDDYHALAFNANHKLLVGTDGGLYRLDNPGATSSPAWVDVNGLGLQITQFYRIALDPTTPNVAFGASQDNGVEKFQDSRTWQGALCCDGYNVAVSPTNHSRVYANQNGTFFRSDNGGASFQGKTPPPGGGDSFRWRVSPNNGDRIVMSSNGLLYESTDAMDSWRPLNGVGWPANVGIEALGLSPTNSNTIYVVGTVSGSPATLVTFDDGGHWQRFGGPGGVNGFADVLRIDPRTNQVAYAVLAARGVFRTTDGGHSWANITGNLPQERTYDIAIDTKGSDTVLYVGTDDGVYASDNLGGSWFKFSQGLPNVLVDNLQIQHYGTSAILAAGTYGRGLWETVVGVTAAIENFGAGPVLVVNGDENDNQITVRLQPSNPSLMEVWEGSSIGPFTDLVGTFSTTAFSQVVVSEGSGSHDTINLENSLANKPVTIWLGSGNDTVNLSPLARTLDSLQGNVIVNGSGGGTKTIHEFDQNDPYSDIYTITSSTTTRSFSALVTYGSVQGVVINGGSGGVTYNVESTASGTPVTINAGAGDVVNLGLNGSLAGITSPVTINGSSSSSTPAVSVNDFNDGISHPNVVLSAGGLTGLSPAPINFGQGALYSLTIYGGYGNNTYTVTGAPGIRGTTLNTGSGDDGATDTVNVQGLAGAGLTIDGSQSDVVNLGLNGSLAGITGPVTFDGFFPHFTPTVRVNDSADGASHPNVVLSGSSLTGLSPGAINFAHGVYALTINGGSGNNTYTVTGTPQSQGTTLNTGSGTDIVNVWGTAYPLTITSAAGSGADVITLGDRLDRLSFITSAVTVNAAATDSLVLNDQGWHNPRTYAVTPTAVTWSGGPTVSYSGLKSLTIYSGGYLPDTFNLSAGTSATAAVTLYGRYRSNTLIGSIAGNFWEITGADTGVLSGAAYPQPVSFHQVGSLMASLGGGGDTFRLDNGATLSGRLTGGGRDTLDYRAYSTNVVVDLQTGFATGVAGGVTGIRSVIGGSGGAAGTYNLLIGAGGDMLTGGAGRRNLLVAGGGASTLNGGNQDDLLIAGRTSYDTQAGLASWLQIAAYWAGTDPYATRVSKLTAGNGVPKLDATTVTGNGGGNTLSGKGELAWVFTDGKDGKIGAFDKATQYVTVAP